MHAWEAVQKTLNYIEEWIGEDISIEELARIAELSQFYYQRLFARLVKKPVREYIKLRRLARACGALRRNNYRILDVALDYGFSSHETFTRAFKETYGITPAQYRKKQIDLDHFDKPDLMLNYIMVDEGVPLVSEGLVLEYHRQVQSSPIHFLGIKGSFYFEMGKMLGERPGVSEPAAIWERFHKVRNSLPGIPGGRIIGVTYYDGDPNGYSAYFIGTETEPGTEQPGFITWVLPPREYLICGFEAENFEQLTTTALGKAMKHTRFWLREHGLIADGFFPEIYYYNTSQAAYMEMWIPFKQRNKKEASE